MSRLSTPDLVLVAFYFLCMGLISRAVATKHADTREYLLGHKNIPWWAVTLSILGSEISALTFVGVPALAYTSNWTYLQLAAGAILARIIVGRWFVEAFYRHQVTSIYEFLLLRFGPWTRNLAAVTFLITRVLMSGVRLYAGALLAKAALGISAPAAILVLAAFGLAYTIQGGISAVIWIEVLQVTVMFSGALASLYVLGIPVGVPPEKFQVLDFRLDPTLEFTVWSALIGATFLNTAIFGTDYDMVQRMLTASDSKRSRLAVVVSGLANVPVSALFLLVGTSLFAFYQAHPDPGLPAQAKEIFPYFILTHLPVGLAGLVVAAVLSVVLSSFQSALNALAGSFVVDLYRPYLAGPERPPEHYVFMARLSMIGFTLGLVAVGLFSQSVTEILTFGLEIGTYTYGALLGVFTVGLFTGRGSDLSCAVSIPVAVVLVLIVKSQSTLAFPWFVMLGWAAGFCVCIVTRSGRIPAYADSP